MSSSPTLQDTNIDDDGMGENCDEDVDEGVHGQISSFASKVESTPKECPGEMMQKSKSTVKESSSIGGSETNQSSPEKNEGELL